MLLFISKNKLLFSIFLFGLLIRMVGTNPGLLIHGDEVMYGDAVKMIIDHNLKTQVLGYPPFIPWIMFVLFKFVFIPISWILYIGLHLNDYLSAIVADLNQVSAFSHLDKIFQSQILGTNWKNALYWGRYITATFGSIIILLTYIVSLTYLKNKNIGIVAAFLVAVNYRLVLNSMIGFPDMFNAFFLLLSFWVTGRLLYKDNLKTYVLTWIFVTMSFLVKYQIYAFFPLLTVHLYKTFSKKGTKKIIYALFKKEMIVGGLIALTILLISHIDYIFNYKDVYKINHQEVLRYSFGRNMLNIYPLSYTFHHGIGQIPSLFGLLGIIVGLLDKKYRTNFLILLSPFPIYLFLYFYYTSGGFFTRNLIVMYPIFLIFVSYFIVRVADYLNMNHIYNLMMIAVLVSTSNINNSLIATLEFNKISPRFEIKSWVENNIDGNIIYGAYNNTIVPDGDKFEFKKLTAPQSSISYAELNEEGYDIVLLDFVVIQSEFIWWMMQPTDIGLKFWNEPFDLLSQNYIALATRELLYNDTLYMTRTPWQAPRYNYAVVDLTKRQIVDKGEKIKEYTFEVNEENWSKLFYLESNKENLSYREEGHDNNGSLYIYHDNDLKGSLRWESEYIPIEEGKQQTVEAYIKNNSYIDKKERDGFIRVDYYKENDTHFILSRPITSYVSKRVFSDSQWHKLITVGLAPKEAKYMTIGFQIDYINDDGLLLDDVTVYESFEKVIPKSKKYSIDDKELFHPNDRGFL